ncbi:MAG: diguanylate cyclase [Candidatus Margulisiibacteriota bacterium]|jgi:diguanylate cyclase (GGDEF)-like protein/putative nucleotidyltransferase with HDIG domain
MLKILINDNKNEFLDKLNLIAPMLGFKLIVKPSYMSFKKYLESTKIDLIIFNPYKDNKRFLGLVQEYNKNQSTAYKAIITLLLDHLQEIPQEIMVDTKFVFAYQTSIKNIEIELRSIKEFIEIEAELFGIKQDNKKNTDNLREYKLNLKAQLDNIKNEIIEYRNLYEASKIINSTLKIEKTLSLILEIISQVLKVKKISIMLLDQNTNELVVQAAKPKRNIIGKRQSLGQGIAGKVAETGIPFFVPDADSIKEIKKSQLTNRGFYQTKSFMCVPLISLDTIIGVLNATDKNDSSFFSERDQRIILEMASLISIAIENAKLYSSVELLALEDGLTKLYNRAFFQKSIAEELDKAKYQNYPLSLAMLDIDFFKNVNDSFGHPVGDVVLQKVASIVKSCTRKTDIAARYGGEEIVTVYIGADTLESYAISEKIRTKIEALELFYIKIKDVNRDETLVVERDKNKLNFLINPLSEDKENSNSQDNYLKKIKKILSDLPFQKFENDNFIITPVKITVSIGLTCYPSDLELSSKAKAMLESTAEQDLVLYMADKALYNAKKNGRNKCLTYRKVQESFQDQSKELEQTTIKNILDKLQHKLEHIYLHSIRVNKISEIIAHGLNLELADVKLIKNAGLLHDVGKLLIDTAILQKPNDITLEELLAIRAHVEKGSLLIEQFPVLHKYLNAVKLHHELLDGSGYPAGISGDRLPIEVRVIAVADYYDTVTNFGCYVKNKNNTFFKQSYFMTKEEAVKKINENSNILYDPKIVEVFNEKFNEIKDIR